MTRTLVVDANTAEPTVVDTPLGAVALWSSRGQGKRVNEDGALVVQVAPDAVVVAVADGMGGMPHGDRASRLALGALASCVAHADVHGTPLDAVVAGFARAQRAVLRGARGGGTTLVVALLERAVVTFVHAGDSEALVVGQRGRVKARTVAHSPTGLALAAGTLDEEAALAHDERHVVNNAVGLAPLVVEVSPPHALAPRDRVLLASDGLFDNLRLGELAPLVGRAPVAEAARRLAAAATARMAGVDPGIACKPDDLTVAVIEASRVAAAAGPRRRSSVARRVAARTRTSRGTNR